MGMPYYYLEYQISVNPTLAQAHQGSNWDCLDMNSNSRLLRLLKLYNNSFVFNKRQWFIHSDFIYKGVKKVRFTLKNSK